VDQYVAIYQVPCSVCGASPVVGIRTPSEQIASTGFCGSHFFGNRGMEDSDLWNTPMEATE